MKKNLAISGGTGSGDDPFVINQGNDINYVDSFVKLGNDTYKVIGDSNGVVRLALAGYATSNGNILTTEYSNSNSLFTNKNRNNIGYYLNTSYYSSLSYYNILVDSNFGLGEISNDSGLLFKNSFNSIGTFKVGMMSMFDYNTNMALDDYFLLNTTSEVGSMVYVYHSNGLLEEARVTDSKRVVPVISVSRSTFTKGTGSFNDPYTI